VGINVSQKEDTMATITDAKITIKHDHTRKTAHVTASCKVHFTPIELCLMKNCPEGKLAKLKCQLWGADSGLTGADDFLYTFGNVFYFPDATPSSPESRTFEDTVGEGLLDEDWGKDEVYAKFTLHNLFTGTTMTRNSNVVSHSF
jgi:hypothetical protein